MKQAIKQTQQMNTYIDNDTYEQFKRHYPIACVDIFVRNPDTNKILLIERTGEPAKNELWPVGGRIKLFQKPDYAVKELVARETSFEVDTSTAKLIGIGDTRFRKRADGNGEDRHTINFSFIVDLAKSSRTEIDFSKGEASRAEWVGSRRELLELKVNRAYSNINALDVALNKEAIELGYFPNPQAVHPYVTRMLLESKIFEGRLRWPSQTITSDERTGLLTPMGPSSAEQAENRHYAHKNDLDLNSELRVVQRDMLDAAFMHSMPVLHIESIVCTKKGVLFKRTKGDPELPYTVLPRDIRPELVSKNIILNEFGNESEKRSGSIDSIGIHRGTALIEVQDRRTIREDGSKGQDIVLTFLEFFETMHTDRKSDIIWAKSPEDLEAFGLNPKLSKVIEDSGAFVREAEAHKPALGGIFKSAKRD